MNNPETPNPSPPVSLLAALRENAEAHRKILIRLSEEADTRSDAACAALAIRSSAMFDLIEVISKTEKQCAANDKLTP